MENEIKNNQEEEHLTKSERKKLKRERKQTERAQERKSGSIKKISIWAALALIIVLLIMWFANQKVLPPTTMQGHIEVSPESHFVTEPMDIRVHKHMLEHADGTGPAGIILNYNCDDFTCEDDFLDNLRKIVGEYPSNVYVAPYRNLGAKLVLTKLNKQEVLDGFDEERIKSFISR